MAKKTTTFDGFDDLLDQPKDSVTLGQNALQGKKVERVTKGAAAGCKPGSTRHTYVMPEEMILKLKAISGYLGRSEVSVVLEILEKGIAEYEDKYGPHVSDINRGN